MIQTHRRHPGTPSVRHQPRRNPLKTVKEFLSATGKTTWQWLAVSNMFKNRPFCPVMSANMKRSSATHCPNSVQRLSEAAGTGEGSVRRSQTEHRTLNAAWIASSDPPDSLMAQSDGPGQSIIAWMTKVHVELRNNLGKLASSPCCA